MVFSTPLSAYYFGSVSLIGILTNLLTIWLIGFLFYGIAAACLLGGLAPLVCRWMGWLIAWPIRFVLLTAVSLSKIPFAAVYTESGFVTAWLVLCYLLLALFLCFKRGGKTCFVIGISGLVLAIAASVAVPRVDAFRLHVLDVGEGQAVLLQSGGENFLIDCGGSNDAKAADKIVQTLLSQGIFQLDGVVLTHYDWDHVNALSNMQERIQVNRFYLPELVEGDSWLPRLGLPEDTVTTISRDTVLPVGTGMLTLFQPGNGKNDNENSMCVLFESKECVILITGDRSRTGELDLLENHTLPKVDVLIAGHHGSKYATSYELLEAIHPEIAVISVGENSYGHPAREVLDRLAEYSCTVYRTDVHGLAYRHLVRKRDPELFRQLPDDRVVQFRPIPLLEHRERRLLTPDLGCNNALGKLRRTACVPQLLADFWTQICHGHILWTLFYQLTRVNYQLY